jgi:hypothetical protein
MVRVVRPESELLKLLPYRYDPRTGIGRTGMRSNRMVHNPRMARIDTSVNQTNMARTMAKLDRSRLTEPILHFSNEPATANLLAHLPSNRSLGACRVNQTNMACTMAKLDRSRLTEPILHYSNEPATANLLAHLPSNRSPGACRVNQTNMARTMAKLDRSRLTEPILHYSKEPATANLLAHLQSDRLPDACRAVMVHE